VIFASTAIPEVTWFFRGVLEGSMGLQI